MSATVSAFLPPRDRRPVGLAVTVAVHALLLLGWQMTRRPPAAPAPDPVRTTIQWIRLPAPPARPQPRREDEARPEPVRVPAHVPARPSAITLLPPPSIPAEPPAAAAPAASASSAPAPPGAAGAAALLERARRDAGAVDRALRKENNPYIVAPLDSPQIRLRKGIAAAAGMEPGMDELVNNTGDGARRTRIVAGGQTYCMTERSAATSIDMIEKHGKWRQTNCPAHESTANGQAWRTARD
ncbi:hypothetical protein HAV22_09830 [Massilia sp. TW-1]|uniref:Uncharacterized protein n=1 Tax=Telluria antibiotica TaxID=2717319 RepID=A0ABX0PAU0_9BURK|nr:hypothetical protein [Telluria antibiotica]NIA53942.1 hypothetical protein [Telluria antibiotica]